MRRFDSFDEEINHVRDVVLILFIQLRQAFYINHVTFPPKTLKGKERFGSLFARYTWKIGKQK